MSTDTVLLIDDDRQVHEHVEALLADLASELFHAHEPEDGIRQAMAQRPDVILLDINMPRMDGLKVCRHLKESDATRDIPVIFLTVDSNVQHLARALECGGTDYITKPVKDMELQARVRVALRTKRLFDMLREQARIDALTGLNNRAALDDALGAATSAFERTGQPMALLMLDLDNFKTINDAHGHGAGDEVLRSVGTTIASCCRPYDTACRFGGDEFGIVLAQAEGAEAEAVAKRILAAVAAVEIRSGTGPIQLTCSIGVVSSHEMGSWVGAADLLKTADAALYQAKRHGRNQIAVHRCE